jgi:hypothetical protein
VIHQADQGGFDHPFRQAVERGDERGELALLPVLVDHHFGAAEGNLLLHGVSIHPQYHAHQADAGVLHLLQEVFEEGGRPPRKKGLVMSHAR